MPNVDLSFAQDPTTLSLAIVFGMVPAIIWLFYWLHEKNRESKRAVLFIKIFIGGALAVVAVLPVQEYIQTLSNNATVLTILWAASEEILKFSVFAIFVLLSRDFFEPIDYPLSLMVIALAFAGFENALYFLQPLQTGSIVVFALAATLRYLGTTLLHALSSSFAGFALGFAYFKSKRTKIFACLFGLLCGITLHSSFNLLIVQNDGAYTFQLFGCLWVVAIIVGLLYEALRRMGSIEYRKDKKDKAVAHIRQLFDDLCKKESIIPTDQIAITEILKKKGLLLGSPEYVSLVQVIEHTRTLYVGYLGSQGIATAKAIETAHSIIPDTVSAKSLSGIIAMLGNASVVPAEREAFGA